MPRKLDLLFCIDASPCHESRCWCMGVLQEFKIYQCGADSFSGELVRLSFGDHASSSDVFPKRRFINLTNPEEDLSQFKEVCSMPF